MHGERLHILIYSETDDESFRLINYYSDSLPRSLLMKLADESQKWPFTGNAGSIVVENALHETAETFGNVDALKHAECMYI